MEQAAAQIHDEWMKRNPKGDWNAALHVPYEQLPEEEKEKDRVQVRLVQRLLVEHPRQEAETEEQHHARVADVFGSLAHEEWRKAHEASKGACTPRLKDVSDGPQVNINVAWKELHPEWQKENLEAGHAAVAAVNSSNLLLASAASVGQPAHGQLAGDSSSQLEQAAAQIHGEWMKRNPKGDWNAALHVPYEQLPEEEKEKDRVQVRLVQRLLVKHPRQEAETEEQHSARVADVFGSLAHEEWRQAHEASKGAGAPRLKDVSDGPQVNINVAWKELHPEWQKENLEAGHAAVAAVNSSFKA